MTTSYPTALDQLTNPASGDSTSSPSHAAQHANANDAIEAIETKLGIGASIPAPVSLSAAAAADYLARIKLAADAQYRASLGLDASSRGVLLMGPGGSTAPDVGLTRTQANTFRVDNGANGDGQLLVSGYLEADSGGAPDNSATFTVDDTTHRVRIGGGGSANLFTVGGRSTSQVEFSVGSGSAYLKGHTSTALTTAVQTQANFNFTPTDWNAGASRDLPGTIALRADGAGSAYWTFDAPGNEMLHVWQGGRAVLEVRQETLGDILEARKPSESETFRRFYLSYQELGWGPGTSASDTRLKRTGVKAMAVDDGAGGAATLDVIGTLTQNGSPVVPLDLFIGPFDQRLTLTSKVFPTANKAYFNAFQVSRPITVTKVVVQIGGATSGNIDVGIYSSSGTTGTRLGSSGSTAATTTFTYQTVNLTAGVALVPGVKYWAAIAADNGTVALFAMFSGDSGQSTQVGPLQASATSSFPLPSSVTLGTNGAVAYGETFLP